MCQFMKLAEPQVIEPVTACEVFIDDLSLRDVEGVRRAPKEDEADEWAKNGLIPDTIWQTSPVKDNASPLAVMELAQRLEIHPAIVAGRVRHETRNFRLLSHFVGRGEVRRQLLTEGWSRREE
jgi:HTH-type transcriptional regulator / antitoxin HigA